MATQTDPLKPEQAPYEQAQEPATPGKSQSPTPSSETQGGNGGAGSSQSLNAQAQQNNNVGGSTSTTTAGTETVHDSVPQVEGEEDLIKWLEEQRDANRRLTEDEIKKLRNMQRTEEIVSGISDAVRSLSNLYFTGQYAPNMYDHTKGMSEATKARWDKTMKEREAENDRFLNYALKIHSLESQKAATVYQQQQDKIKADREDIKLDIAQAKAEMEAAKNDVWMKVQLGKLDKDAADAELKRIEAEYAQKYGMLMGRKSYRSSGAGQKKASPTGTAAKKKSPTA